MALVNRSGCINTQFSPSIATLIKPVIESIVNGDYFPRKIIMRTQTKHSHSLPSFYSCSISSSEGRRGIPEKWSCQENVFICIASKWDDNEINSIRKRKNVLKCSVFRCRISWNVTRLSGFGFTTAKYVTCSTPTFDRILLCDAGEDGTSIAQAGINVINVLNLFLCAFTNLSLSAFFYIFQFQFQLEVNGCIRCDLIA